ncbi:MAG TPA: 50S ribosomal protein L21 [Patescibacteria group bacterium]|nr:50S ribosomal protein L21 [Patescibacteria group bacterium]
MKIAVIKTGGKQQVVKEKDKLKIERVISKAGLPVVAGDKLEFDTLLVADGDKLDIGAPLVNSKVEATVIREGRTKKVTGVKYKPKTRRATSYGHKQYFTEVEITKI